MKLGTSRALVAPLDDVVNRSTQNSCDKTDRKTSNA